MIDHHRSLALVVFALVALAAGCAADVVDEEPQGATSESALRGTAVSITSPDNGSTVSGKLALTAVVSSRVSWVNFDVDSHYAASSPPYTYTWDSTKVADGVHTLSVEAKNSSGRVLGTASVTVHVANASVVVDAGAGGSPDSGGSSTSPSHFATLGPHATLPSEGACAGWVDARPTAENIADNATANHTVPTADWLAAFHANPINACGNDLWCKDLQQVTGNFTGSTDMILRWGACKWGIDEDVARAEATDESNWHQSQVGDSDTVCHSRNVSAGALNYWSEPSPCQPSKGLLQLKLVYYNAAPYAATSTALNVDFAYGSIRACMNGDQSYLTTTQSTAFGPYPPTTTDDALWGCIGRHYSGAWGDSGAVDYVNRVKSILANKGWPH